MGGNFGQKVIDYARGKRDDDDNDININFDQAGTDYSALLQAGLGGQMSVMDDLIRFESQIRPRMAEIEMDTLERMFPRQMNLYRRIMPEMTALENQSTRDTRAAELADIERFGPQLQAAADRLRPQQAQMMDLMNRQAIAGLQAGQELSPYESRLNEQRTGNIFANSGLSGYGPLESMTRLELRNRAGRQKEEAARRFAHQQMQVTAATQLDVPQYLTGRVSRTPINIAPGVFSQTQSLSPGQVLNPDAQGIYDLAAMNMGVDMYNQGNNRKSRYTPFNTGFEFGF